MLFPIMYIEMMAPSSFNINAHLSIELIHCHLFFRDCLRMLFEVKSIRWIERLFSEESVPPCHCSELQLGVEMFYLIYL